MVPPSAGRRVRDIDSRYLKALRQRITTFPTAHVAPLLANVETDSAFDKDHLERYEYEMIGGNHSRQVFQELVQEPIHRLQKSCHHRLAALYHNLTDEKALALGKQHNMTAETQLASKFYDDVNLTRHLFTAIEQPSEKKLMGFTDKMRDSFIKVFGIEV